MLTESQYNVNKIIAKRADSTNMCMKPLLGLARQLHISLGIVVSSALLRN